MKKPRVFREHSIFLHTLQVVTIAILATALYAGTNSNNQTPSYTIADTGQVVCYNERNQPCSTEENKAYAGQDAHYKGNQPEYHDNGDGTVTDLVTGLMWQKDPGQKVTYNQAQQGAANLRLGGHDDWRLPSIKEMYSLILFSGSTSRTAAESVPYIDTRFFVFNYGDESRERFIDAQFWTSNEYRSTTMNGNRTVFGVNFADGRIKGYPVVRPGQGDNTMFVRYVRGNPAYGKNNFRDNRDGTITDTTTGLMWTKADSGILNAGNNGAMNWKDALTWAENFSYAGHDDWRLPNAKELQSIVDYTRAPAVTNSAAIDPVFQTSTIKGPDGKTDYPYYWTSTTHLDGPAGGNGAAYIAFGKGWGYMRSPFGGGPVLMDVHGAGCQRSDPKSGDASAWPYGRGPQGDVIRIQNFVRLVRNAQ